MINLDSPAQRTPLRAGRYNTSAIEGTWPKVSDISRKGMDAEGEVRL